MRERPKAKRGKPFCMGESYCGFPLFATRFVKAGIYLILYLEYDVIKKITNKIYTPKLLVFGQDKKNTQ